MFGIQLAEKCMLWDLWHRMINEGGWVSHTLLGRFGSCPILRAPLGLAYVTGACVSLN